MTRMIKNGLLMAVAIGVIGIATGCGGGSSAPAVKEWRTEEVFKDANVIHHDFKLNLNGDGFAVWVERTGAMYKIKAKRYHDGAWDSAESILRTYNGGVQSFRTLKLALQETGDMAIVSWLIKKTTGTFELRGTVFDGTSWQFPSTHIFSNSQVWGINNHIAVAIDDHSDKTKAEGRVLFSTKNLSGKYDIRYKRYKNGWIPGSTLLEFTAPDAREPDIAFDRDQKLVMAWQQDGEILARYYKKSGANYILGGVIKQVNENIWMTSCRSPKVMFTKNHTAVAVWAQGIGNYWLYANTFDESSASWNVTSFKNSDSGKIRGLVLAADNKEKDRIVVLREEQVAPNKKRLMAAAFDTNANSWDEMEQLNSDDEHNIIYTDLTSDSDGNMMAIWDEWKPGDKWHIYANYYDQVAAEWNGAKAVDNQSNNAIVPKVSFDGSEAIVHWRQLDGGITKLYSNTYK